MYIFYSNLRIGINKEGIKNNLKSCNGGASLLETKGHILPTVTLV